MTQGIGPWFAAIGLPQYAQAFRANDIDATLLPGLSAEDLKEIGVASLGHRKIILDAIAASGRTARPAAPAVVVAAARAHPRDYTPRHLADKVLQSRSALEGERKQVSVLFADVQGSMELAEQFDPEQWHRVLDGFFAILAEGVHRFEGTVNQYTGDGIMALFGAPNSARGPCAAGLLRGAAPAMRDRAIRHRGQARAWGSAGTTPSRWRRSGPRRRPI